MNPPSTDSTPAPAAESGPVLRPMTFEESFRALSLKLSPPPWLRANPGLGLTLAYLILSAVGVAYSWAFYRNLGVNFLDFAETTDFVIAVIREPLPVLLVVLSVPFYMFYGAAMVRLFRFLRRVWPGFARWAQRAEAKPRAAYSSATVVTSQILFIGVYALLFVMIYSRYQAGKIRAGDFRPVTVEFKADALRDQGATWSGALVGTTTRFIFLYDRPSNRVEVVPLESVARLRLPPRRSKAEKSVEPAQAVPTPVLGAPQPLPLATPASPVTPAPTPAP